MQGWPERYDTKARARESVLCVGLDPEPDHIPPQFGEGVEATLDYMIRVVDAAAALAPVVKPQSAFWEAMGPDGIRALIQLVEYAHQKDLLVILDAKRNDIGNTQRAYGKSVYDIIGVDACTVNTYLGPTFMPMPKDLGKEGKDQIWLPWLSEGRCAIAMVRTSNPDSDVVQLVKLESGLYMYQYMAGLVCDWNEIVEQATGGLGSIGGVVGATQDEAEDCRERLGDLFILTPGYGAQGGGAATAVLTIPGLNGKLRGVINSSRGITKAWSGKEGDPIEHVIAAMVAANDELNAALTARLGHDPYKMAA